ncbi:MAG: nucleoside recognition membrane protein YjiH, partial [Moritella dasanensis]
MTKPTANDPKVKIGGYIALVFAIVFFSGLMKSNEWYGVFDFTTLNGSFGKVAYSVSDTADGVEVATT